LEVRLNNGALVSKRNMGRVLKKLHKLQSEKGPEGRDALEELFRGCTVDNNKTTPMSDDATEMLQGMRLLEKDGTVSRLVRNVVVSACKWIDDHVDVRSPLPHAKPTAHSHRPIVHFIEAPQVSVPTH